jgi:hypothetical protein
MPVYPSRFALHTLDDGNSHIDLFIDTGAEFLTTYEIESGRIEDTIKYLMNHQKLLIISNPIEDEFRLKAIRKRDHRKIYMHHEGLIQSGGRLESICYAELIGIPTEIFFLMESSVDNETEGGLDILS